jgi:glutamate racemase
MPATNPVGIFDSGYGGLTVMKEIVQKLPAYDYIYLGDNARAPYGNRSFDTVYHYTLECVEWFFKQGCPLVILACNTASAKALRSIQQNDLERIAPGKRVLGVIRPTTEVIGNYTESRSIGILGTAGTVQSGSYEIEIHKFFPDIKVHQEACPMWVPLIENNEHLSKGADYFVKKHLENIMAQSPVIDTLLLACTHYPLMIDKIKEYVPIGTTIISQGEIVANSLADYLRRHPAMEESISKGSSKQFFTTDSAEDFNSKASLFFGEEVAAKHLELSAQPA